MARVVHCRADYEALGREISADQFKDGIAVWNPHRERAVRKERNKRVSYQTWPASLADRFTNLITHLKKRYGSEIGLEIAVKRLETAHPEEKEQEEEC